ncbi:Por secretion system C-terminal sorting domain-containing protein [Polaribacter sp. KT25b]|uniref:T9SS type A sorting domain-containing protein n=1 Tax=Polaribacter sp. KT25b TaxID=1855336 RepID=UPI000879BAA7|nr:T9SS type A sorting domain-containing protein [Polaribacter sp. KT25b]SDR92477.1 Por secretion system C-terminal sorting domain-containing protein [Polaribacter sp. KT25b]
MKIKLLYTLFLITSFTYSQRTYMPDDVFEAHMIRLGYDNVLDDYVSTNAINQIKTLNLGGDIVDPTGIEDFIALEKLVLDHNKIKTIDVSKNTKLEYLDLGSNELTSINVSTLINLETLYLGGNMLTSINISQNNELIKLGLSANKLKSINLEYNKKLERLALSENLFTSIDVSSNTKLTYLYANDNKDLYSLNMSNLKYNEISSLSNIRNCPNLYCVTVTDVAAAFDKFKVEQQRDSHTGFSLNCTETTSIPDANFEQYLINLGYDSGEIDGKVITGNLSAINSLNIKSKGISNLSGIEDFINLVELNAANNQISTIDLSKNLLLENLFIANNQLQTIDLSNNLQLKNIDVGENDLSNLDVHLLVDLVTLYCDQNQLTVINLFSNKELLVLIANENQLKTVDIRENDNLFLIDVENNLLESLTIKNGSNTKITTFKAKGNLNLTCIEVDDISFSNTNWTDKDTVANYSTNCAPANNDCVNAIPLIFGQQTYGDVINGNTNNDAICAEGTVLADVWYSIIVNDSGKLSFQGTGFGGLLKFAVYNSCTSTQPVACGETISLSNLIVGTKLYVKVWLETNSPKNVKNLSESGTFIFTAEDTSVLSAKDYLIDKDGLNVFPNPSLSSNFISIESNNSMSNIELYSTNGQKIISKRIKNLSNIDLDISKVSTGVYILKVKADNQIISKKIVIK